MLQQKNENTTNLNLTLNEQLDLIIKNAQPVITINEESLKNSSNPYNSLGSEILSIYRETNNEYLKNTSALRSDNVTWKDLYTSNFQNANLQFPQITGEFSEKANELLLKYYAAFTGDTENKIYEVSQKFEDLIKNSTELNEADKNALYCFIAESKFLTLANDEFKQVFSLRKGNFKYNAVLVEDWDGKWDNCMRSHLSSGVAGNLYWVLSGTILRDNVDCIGVASGWW